MSRPRRSALLALVFGLALPAWGQTIALNKNSFGPNEQIVIEIGTIAFVNRCGPGGINDFIGRAANVYVIPSGSVPGSGGSLADVSGIPNTVQSFILGGGIFDEIIGITQPSGTIGTGTYSVVYDECQDGVLGPEDTVFPSLFTVTIPAGVPSLPGFAALKGDASAQAVHWAEAFAAASGLFAAADAVALVGALTDPTDALLWVLQQSLFEGTGINPTAITLDILANTSRHYAGIAADPPDPDFDRLAELGARTSLSPLSGIPLQSALVDVADGVQEEEALLLALLQSLERYQGAEAAGDAQWALIHARNIQRYATLLTVQLPVSSDALGALEAALAADAQPLDATADALESFRSRVAASGFTPDEVALATDLGLSGPDLDALRAALADVDSYDFEEADLSAAISAIQSTTGALLASLSALAADIGPVIATLEAAVADQAPIADAGGPYAAAAGAPTSLDGSGSTSPLAITAYEWDTDGDGAFDDATGATPAAAFPTSGTGLVGLRVTNAAGLSAIDYAAVSVSESNAPPTVVSFSPPLLGPVLAVGVARAFAVEATDPEGEEVSIEWRVDGAPAAVGSSFPFTPATAGLVLIEAVLVDSPPVGSPGGAATTRVQWAATVGMPAADSPNIVATPNPAELGSDFIVPGGFNFAVEVANVGTAPLSISAASITAADANDAFGFIGLTTTADSGAEVTLPAVVSPGGSVFAQLLYSPRRGLSSSTLTVVSDDPDEPTLDVPLRATATEAVFVVDPTSVDFGPVSIGAGPSCVEVTVSNSGDAPGFADQFLFDPSTPDSPFSVSEAGGDLASYVLDVPDGTSKTFDVCFDPSTEGLASATLEFTTQATGNEAFSALTKSVALSGTGVAGDEDTERPECGPIRIGREGRGKVVTSASDDVGIVRAEVRTLRNLEAFFNGAGPFAQGNVYDFPAPAPTVDVVAERVDVTSGRVGIVVRFFDAAGNHRDCDPVVDQLAATADAFALGQNAPNPVGPEGTTIPFALAERGPVRLAVYDALGREVAVVAEGEMGPGAFALSWDGADGFGRSLAPGVYVVRLTAGAFEATRRLVLVR